MHSSPAAIPRASLVVPASHPRMVAKALASVSDEIVLDLEDAVAPEAKELARDAVVEVLVGSTDRQLAVRINQVGSPWCHRDVLAVVGALAEGARPVTLVVPKVESAADVDFVDHLLRGALADIGGATAVSLDLLIESAAGLRALDQIAAAGERVRALVVGYADLAADLGRDTGGDPALWDAVRHQIVSAGRAAGRSLIDGPWLGTAADDAFTRDRDRARALGFDGTWVIHPAQVEAATAIYSPTVQQLAWARRVVSTLEASVAEGSGAVALDGEMLDEAVAVRARRVLAREAAQR